MTQGSDELERRAMRALEDVFDQPSDKREAWARAQYADDEDLLARVLSLLTAENSASSSIRTGGAKALIEDELHPERAGAYKITSLIGRGGMGAVYTGERDAGDFDHQVAIKVIRPGILSDKLVERFETERQILAKLNHTGIARLFDGGTLADGSPYIVMEYVDGTPVTEWIDQKTLSLDDRLWIFSDICAAVEYAHQNLVIHRDITPSNVLIDKGGAAKLIDFGIAKPQSMEEGPEHADPGSLASLSFTPGFAAPERKRGAPANTLSDIFSLGKLLEAMLEGFARDEDLSAIIARASAADPNDRYPSVSALSEDVRNYRTGYPVEAFEGGGWYIWKKYFGRRKLLVSSAVMAFAALSTALGVTWVQYQTAQAERAAADQRFEEVRALSTFMMFDLYDELVKAPGNTKAIEMLANRAQSYLESLESDDRASLDVKIETGAGLKLLADILGNPKNQNLGRRADAGELLDRAETYLEALLARHPGNDEIIRKLAETKVSNAIHKYVSDDENEKAHTLASEAADLLQPLASRPGADYSDRSSFIRAKMMSAVPLPWIGRDVEGIDILRDVRSEAAQLVESDPDNLEAKSLLGSMNVELARAIVRYENNGGVTEDTVPIWDDAIALRLQVHEANPEDSRAYRSLVSIYSERSAALRGQDRFDESLRDLEAAERIGDELLAIDPEDSWLQRMTQGAREERIKTLSFSGRHEEAVELVALQYPPALAEYEAHSDNSGYVREWGYTQIIFATAYLEAGRMEEGCTMVQSARAAWSRFDEMSGITETDRNVSIHNLEVLEGRCAS